MKIRNKYNLTDQMLEKPPIRGGVRVELGDSQVQGLIARYNSDGTYSLIVLFRIFGAGGLSEKGRPLRGRQQRITLGRNTEIKVIEARMKALEIRAKANSGVDPRDELRAKYLLRSSRNVRAVVHDYIEKYAKINKSSWKNTERALKNYFVTAYGDRPIDSINRADIHRLLDDIIAQGKVGSAREVKKYVCALFNWAVNREICPSNPALNLDRKDLNPNKDAGRSLSDDEIKAFYKSCYRLGYPFGDLFLLLLFTGQRRGDWADARVDEINIKDKCLEIPSSRYKSRRDHIVSFSDSVLEIVENLPKWAYNNYHLLTTTSGKRPVSGFGKAKERLDAYMVEELNKIHRVTDYKLKPFRTHDLRVTCETRLANLGFNQDVRDSVLGHSRSGLQRIYNKYDYANEKREAMQAYSEHLEEVIDGLG